MIETNRQCKWPLKDSYIDTNQSGNLYKWNRMKDYSVGSSYATISKAIIICSTLGSIPSTEKDSKIGWGRDENTVNPDPILRRSLHLNHLWNYILRLTGSDSNLKLFRNAIFTCHLFRESTPSPSQSTQWRLLKEFLQFKTKRCFLCGRKLLFSLLGT